MEKLVWVFLLLAFLSVCLSAVLVFENISLNSKIVLLNQNLDQKQNQIESQSQTIFQLTQNISLQQNELILQAKTIENYSRLLYTTQSRLSDLELELNLTRNSLNQSTGQLLRTRAEISELSKELSSIENNVDSSISWFKENSHLPANLATFQDDIKSNCIHSNILNLACVQYFMHEDFNFTYKLDNIDKLSTIDQMLAKQGGDCEDYSLFLMATINSLKQDNQKLQLETWQESNNKYIVYQSSSQYWFYNGVARNIGLIRDTNPYMICFTTFYNGTALEGHCVVAISTHKLRFSSELDSLNGADVFEPQNGEYLGKIGDNYILCTNNETDCELKLNHISLIVSDSDLIQFTNGKWSNYLEYKQKIMSLKNSLTNSN